MSLDPLADSPVAHVFQQDTHCGILKRTELGADFIYDPDFLGSVAISLPRSREVYSSQGVNLPPFFANLLPEGWVLQAISGRLKTSRDDLLSLLVAVGNDTIGDVWVSWEPQKTAPPVETWDIRTRTFEEIVTQQYADPTRPIASVSIPGVQDKVSANRVTIPGRLGKTPHALLKVNRNPEKFPRLIENEHFFMELARSCGIPAAKTRIVEDASGESGLWVERFDRRGTERVHQEDACQFLNIYPAEKYNVSARAVAEGLRQVCAAGSREVLGFIELYAFSILIGNGDLHAKNISILEENKGLYQLSPAYDLLTTLPYGDDKMALKLNGRDANFKGRYLLEFGESLGIPYKATRHRLERLLRRLSQVAPDVSTIGFESKATKHIKETLHRSAVKLADFN